MANILGIIPARGGSKGIKRKNIRLLCGKPLIWHSINEAQKSKLLTRFVVSTEDAEIASIAKSYNAEVIVRPTKLAQDDTPMIPVLKHVIEELKEKEGYRTDIVVLIPPTCPLRIAQDIDKGINIFQNSVCDSVVAVYPMEHPLYWALKEEKGYLEHVFSKKYYYARKQDLPQTYLDGPIYIMKPEKLFKSNGFITKKTIPYVVPRETGLDIDHEFDFNLVEFFMIKRTKERCNL